MSGSIGYIMLAFALYLMGMIIIGAIYAKKNTSSEDYFLGVGVYLDLWLLYRHRHRI